MTTLYTLHQLAAFAIGACLGSFLGVGVLRIPEGRSLVSPPSHCPVCETPLRWWDNIPLVSWLVLRGRCRHCDTPISPLYPLLELTMGGTTWLLYRRFVAASDPLDPTALLAWGVYVMFGWMLLLSAYTDLRARIIPEIGSIYAVPVGIGAALFLEAIGYQGWLAIGWRNAVLGAALGGGVLGLASFLWFRTFGSEGMAWGDVRLMAMIGAFLGPVPGAWVVLLMASLLGAAAGIVAALVQGRSGYLPFGPALAVAALVYVLVGDALVRAVLPGMASFL